MGFQSKHFPHESDGDESKLKKKEDHALVKYIKFQVRIVFLFSSLTGKQNKNKSSSD